MPKLETHTDKRKKKNLQMMAMAMIILVAFIIHTALKSLNLKEKWKKEGYRLGKRAKHESMH